VNKAEKKAPRQHAESFKRDAVRLMSNREGKTVVQLAKDLGVTPSQLYEWQNKYAEAAQEPTEAMQAELVRLRKENQQLREERDVLKKPPPSSSRPLVKRGSSRDEEG
jgi:transposase